MYVNATAEQNSSNTTHKYLRQQPTLMRAHNPFACSNCEWERCVDNHTTPHHPPTQAPIPSHRKLRLLWVNERCKQRQRRRQSKQRLRCQLKLRKQPLNHVHTTATLLMSMCAPHEYITSNICIYITYYLLVYYRMPRCTYVIFSTRYLHVFGDGYNIFTSVAHLTCDTMRRATNGNTKWRVSANRDICTSPYTDAISFLHAQHTSDE